MPQREGTDKKIGICAFLSALKVPPFRTHQVPAPENVRGIQSQQNDKRGVLLTEPQKLCESQQFQRPNCQGGRKSKKERRQPSEDEEEQGKGK